MLISEDYKKQLVDLHDKVAAFGGIKSKNEAQRDILMKYSQILKTTDFLDYGCGKGWLAAAMPFPIKEYDPCIEGKDGPAQPADFVFCADVLEHVEPECLDNVLKDLQRCTLKYGLFLIHTGAARQTLNDGRNAHLIQESAVWWHAKLAPYFIVRAMSRVAAEGIQFDVLALKPD